MSAENPTAKPRGAKAFVFWTLLFLLPVILVALLEGGLRLGGFGGYAPVFRRVGRTPHGELVITDQAGAASYFFANRDRPGYNDQYSFYEPKGTNTVRIVFVGESATKGFPQPRNLDVLRADPEFRENAADAVVAAVPFRADAEAAA